MPSFLGVGAETAGYADVACVSCNQFMPRSALSARPSVGLRTPPDLKWLRNQRAAVAGDLKRAESRITWLIKRLDRLMSELPQIQAELSWTQERLATKSAEHAALIRTIELTEAGFNSLADGTVRAFGGRYGKRGGLTAFVQEHLRAIAPQSIGQAELTKLTAAHFGIVLLTREERMRHSDSVRTILRQVRDTYGVLERIPGSRGKWSQPRWRWKPEPTLDNLHKLAMAAGVGVTHDGVTYPHSVRGEVGG